MARAQLAVAAGFPIQYSLQEDQPYYTNDLVNEISSFQEQAIQLQHNSTGRYTCEICDRSFTRLYNLKSHIITHENIRPFECSECHQRFARNHDLNRIFLYLC